MSKGISFVLASFGTWLTRRFGSVRPGEDPPIRVILPEGTDPHMMVPRGSTIHLDFCTQVPEHVHNWKRPELNLSNRDSISFSITGEVCACGATRVYHGPAYGFTVTEPNPLLVGRDTPHEADQPTEAK